MSYFLLETSFPESIMLTKNNTDTLRLRSLLFSMLVIASSSSAAEFEVGEPWKTIEGWQIRVDRSLDNSCFLIRRYPDNSLLQLGYNKPSQSMYIMVGSPSWQSLEAGEKQPITLRFGHAEPRVIQANRVEQYGVPVLVAGLGPYEKLGDFMNEFMLKHSLRVEYPNAAALRLSLKSSFKGVAVLKDCQKRFDKMEPEKD